jgi:hypothetical protein
LIFPAFLAFLGVAVPFLQLLKLCTVALAILYVLFGPAPPQPF